MKTPSTAISDAERAVQNYKHELMVRVMSQIIHLALKKPFISPADIDPDIVPESSHQGVISNSWNSLTALEIIERLPMGYTDPDRKIFGGRIKNTNEGAKGRWTGAYRLRSKLMALMWLDRNGNLPMRLEGAITEQLEMA
jgi:hypothetical protein